MPATDYNIMAVAISMPFLYYINIGLCFSAYKNHNTRVAVANMLVAVGQIVDMLATNYDAMVVVAGKPFPSHIKTGFRFSAYKNYKAREVVPIPGMPVRDMLATNMRVIDMSVAGISIASVPTINVLVVKTFISNILLAVFAFSIAKIVAQR